MQNFLPVTKQEMQQRGWDQVDFVYITGDAYVDHPSFGSAIISRLLESRGYRVGIIPQPDWRHKESIQTFGEPRLGFLVTAGTQSQGNIARKILILRAARWDFGRICQQSYTAT